MSSAEPDQFIRMAVDRLRQAGWSVIPPERIISLNISQRGHGPDVEATVTAIMPGVDVFCVGRDGPVDLSVEDPELRWSWLQDRLSAVEVKRDAASRSWAWRYDLDGYTPADPMASGMAEPVRVGPDAPMADGMAELRIIRERPGKAPKYRTFAVPGNSTILILATGQRVVMRPGITRVVTSPTWAHEEV